MGARGRGGPLREGLIAAGTFPGWESGVAPPRRRAKFYPETAESLSERF